MALMEWSDSFSVEIELIDNQHKRLIEQINRLDEAVRDSVRNPKIPQILAELVSLTTEHFSQEETVMSQSGYVGIGEHCMLHEKLLRTIVDVEGKVKSGKMSASANLPGFLHFWLEKHIAGHDQKYAQHIKSMKPAGAVRD